MDVNCGLWTSGWTDATDGMDLQLCVKLLVGRRKSRDFLLNVMVSQVKKGAGEKRVRSLFDVGLIYIRRRLCVIIAVLCLIGY